MSTLRMRLEEVMAAKGWEHADVVRISGQSSSVVSQWLGKGSKEIKSIGRLEAAMRLAEESGYSVLWIATGTGPKMAARSADAAPARIPGRWHPVIDWETPEDLPGNEFAIIPRVSVRLDAGGGAMVFEEEDEPPLSFRRDFLHRSHVTSKRNLIVVHVRGDSMMPAIADGDLVLCDRGQTAVLDGEVYAINYGGQLRVKRLRKRFDGGVVIISDNSGKYPPESLSAAEAQHITILGRVFWRGGSL